MSDPAADLLSEIHAFINDVNRGNASAALRRLTEDVCIVEDIAPFCWTGAEAGQWLAAMAANAKRVGVVAVTMTPGEPQRIEVEEPYAYCIIPGFDARRTSGCLAGERAHYLCNEQRWRTVADQRFNLDR